jgi:hypothetical protein
MGSLMFMKSYFYQCIADCKAYGTCRAAAVSEQGIKINVRFYRFIGALVKYRCLSVPRSQFAFGTSCKNCYQENQHEKGLSSFQHKVFYYLLTSFKAISLHGTYLFQFNHSR